MIEVVEVRQKTVRGGGSFRYAVVSGTPADHASWWSFDDEQEVRDRHWDIAPGEVVMDVGAAFGSYALPALAMGGRVIAFNPAPFDAELLEKNLELNPELKRRCLVVREGIHERDGWFDPDHNLFTPDTPEQAESAPELYGTIGNRADGGAGFPKNQRIKVVSLDSFISTRPGVDRVDYVKMDIEGAELGALRGGEGLLRRWRPRLLIECHNFHDPKMEEKVQSFLAGLAVGYRFFGPVPHCAVSHLYAEVPR